MTAQIINFTEKRQAIIDRRNQFYAPALLLPAGIVAFGVFWLIVGAAVVRTWPHVRLP